MQLIDLTGRAQDRWAHVGDEDPIPAEGPVIVPAARLFEVAEGRETGIHVGNDTDPEDLVPLFDRLQLVSVAFPSFADGRGFSIGRKLRALGFDGTLRASGPVIADQFAYLIACGFDEVCIPDALAERQPPEQWEAARRLISAGYQRGLGAGRSILDARTGR